MVRRHEQCSFCWVLLSVVSVGALVLLVQNIALSWRVEMARDQVEIFQDMVDARRDNSDVGKQDRIDYIVGYYPSGTKQSAGSALDFIVEAARASAIRELQR